MSEAEEREKARQQAGQDLVDIAALKKSEPFNRYWLRFLAQKKEQLREKFTDEPPEKCSHEEREIRRRLLKFCEELEGMMAQHEAVCRATVES